MKAFIEILISVAFFAGLYYMFTVPSTSEVAQEFTYGYNNGGK